MKKQQQYLAVVFGHNLQLFLERKGLTLNDMAQACTITEGLLRDYIDGRECPDLVDLLKLAQFLAISPDMLLEGAPSLLASNSLSPDAEKITEQFLLVEGTNRGNRFKNLIKKLDDDAS
ncbi:MAG: helix-turn-helix domain-containing protein [Alphaproteobacteria bacterium]